MQAQLAEKPKQPVNGQTFFKKVGECLYRYPNTGTYYALVKRHGKQFRRSLKTSDRQLADRRLADFRAKAGRRVNGAQDHAITFMELAKNWSDAARTRIKPNSARSMDLSIRQLNKHFGTLQVRNITTADCHGWEKKRGADISASTFNHDRTALVAVLNFGMREGLLLDNPALSIARRKLPKGKVVIPTKEQFSLLVKTIRSADCRAWTAANLIELLAYSGMRLSEATALTWGEVDFERSQFVVTGGIKGTKNHEARAVPLFPAMRSLLERIRSEREQPTTANERIISTGHARKAMSTACKKAELATFPSSPVPALLCLPGHRGRS